MQFPCRERVVASCKGVDFKIRSIVRSCNRVDFEIRWVVRSCNGVDFEIQWVVRSCNGVDFEIWSVVRSCNGVDFEIRSVVRSCSGVDFEIWSVVRSCNGVEIGHRSIANPRNGVVFTRATFARDDKVESAEDREVAASCCAGKACSNTEAVEFTTSLICEKVGGRQYNLARTARTIRVRRHGSFRAFIMCSFLSCRLTPCPQAEVDRRKPKGQYANRLFPQRQAFQILTLSVADPIEKRETGRSGSVPAPRKPRSQLRRKPFSPGGSTSKPSFPRQASVGRC